MALKLKKHIPTITFEYEFADAKKVNFTYRAASTIQLEEAVKIGDENIEGQIAFIEKTLRENITGERIDDLIAEVKEGNIFEFKETLDLEVGKQKRKR